jgi:hypothetical protein
MESIGREKMLKLDCWGWEKKLATQLFIKYGSKDFHISSSGGIFHVVGPTRASKKYWWEENLLESFQ